MASSHCLSVVLTTAPSNAGERSEQKKCTYKIRPHECDDKIKSIVVTTVLILLMILVVMILMKIQIEMTMMLLLMTVWMRMRMIMTMG